MVGYHKDKILVTILVNHILPS